MMRMAKLPVVALVALISLAGCGGEQVQDIDASLRAATAAAIPGADLAKITISAPERHAAKWTWQASYDGKSFSCDADEHMRLPSCMAI